MRETDEEEDMQELKKKQNELVETVTHISRSVDEIKDQFTKAFPANDVDGHRRAHEVMMEDIQAKKKLAQAIKEKTISGLVWAAMVGAGIAFWHEILRITGR